ncbi:MAG: dihydrolipoyl dehydrogenase [Prevotella sp.]|nr:dihydrolipoyl dehydrogenase [Prevotella sp.]
MTRTDLIVIGAGPGGYRAASFAAIHGLKVVVFEPAQLGGTCLNRGCIPTKALARNAEVVQTLHEAEAYGLDGLHYSLDFKRVMTRKEQVVASLRSGIETLLSNPNITLVRQAAHFKDSHTVADDEGNEYTAPHIIVATGSEPKQLRLEHYDEGAAIQSDELLSMDTLPGSLCIVGAGVIGMEFASILSAFGVEVIVVEFLKECLPALDSDIAKRLRKTLERRGVSFIMQAAVNSITFVPDSGEEPLRRVTYTRKGREETVEADMVLMAVGRTPRISPDFACAGFEYDQRSGIHVDEHFQTTVPGIYAVGDVNGRHMLAHAAEMQALYVVGSILKQRCAEAEKKGGKAAPEQLQAPSDKLLCAMNSVEELSREVIPAAIFTYPEAACVGLSEDQCREQGITYSCRKSFYRANGKALAMNESEGMLKLLADADDRIIGCHVFGAHAADLVQEVSVLICRQTTVSQLRHMVHIHPTLSEVLLAAAEM